MLSPDVENLRYFQSVELKIGDVPVSISRTGFTGDLGYEIWVDADEAVAVWDSVYEASEGHGVLPMGIIGLLMARIEVGLLLLDVDFGSSRFAWTDADCSTPVELGFGWWFRTLAEDDRAFIGRRAIEHELASGSRWKMVGLTIDWKSWDDLHRRNELEPAKDHTPKEYLSTLYDDDETRVGYATSLMYSPMVQRHIAIARVRPELASPGTAANMEVTLNHEWQSVKVHVTRMPFYNPAHKTA